MSFPTYKINNDFDSENLLNKFSQFNEYYAWNKSINPSGATIFNTATRKFSGKNACEITFANSMPVEFNAGNDKMQIVARNTGLHKIRFSFYKDDADADINFTVKCFVAGVNSANVTYTTNLFDTSGFQNGKWNSYFQELYLVENQILDFSFIAQSDTSGAKLYFDGLKLSLNDRSLPLSVPFNEPLINDYEDKIILNLPLMQPGEKITINEGRLVDSTIGDFVKFSIIAPSPLQANFQNLFFSQPYVINDYTDLNTIDNILFVIKNENSVAFQPNPFTIKLLIQK
ncbi:MAG: hypothetical protein LH615_04130 [Ferruginibacter sp.]|nr:hypothetical protein [Ferruginibacter sp.]